MEPVPDKIANSSELSDGELAKLAQQGDIEGGRRLFSKYEGMLNSLARKLYAHAPNDLLQQGYLVAWERFDTFGPPYNFKAWIGRILGNIANNWRRSDTSRAPFFGPEAEDKDIYEMWERRIAADRSDLDRLLEILKEDLNTLDATAQQVGRYMLIFFAENEKWPSKREIERDLGVPGSSALRCREKVLKTWERDCKASGFWPLA